MAEAFGIVGVIGLAIQITQVVVEFGTDWKHAPDNVKTFMAELGTLKTVLSETTTNLLLNLDLADAFQDRRSVLLSQLGPNAPPITDTKHMLEICGKELTSVLKELKKSDQGHRLGWERMKRALLAKDTRDSVGNLCRQCQTLNNMLSIDALVLGAITYKEVREARKEQQEWQQVGIEISLGMRDDLNEVKRQQENHERQAILDWLTPIDFTSQQYDFITRRQEGTGKWLLGSTEYQAWADNKEKILFCPGIPGAGKTILTSVVVEELTKSSQKDKSIGVAYLYCTFQPQHKQKAQDLLKSLLKQLAQRQPSLPESIKSLYETYKETPKQPSFDEISNALQSVAAMYSRVFIAVDALDEFQEYHGGLPNRTEFLSALFSLQSITGANLFATSRDVPEITSQFEGSIVLPIRATDDDIQRYVDGRKLRLPKFVGRTPQQQDELQKKLREEIKTEIVEAVDGMFLLAQLYLDSLDNKTSPNALRTVLAKLAKQENLPGGSRAYDHAYQDAMNRIEGQVSDQKILAKRVLSWINYAKRPLTTSELQHALAVETGPQLDKDNLTSIEDMISVCAGLVTVDDQSGIIRLVHHTIQEYFKRTEDIWFRDMESEITTACITYLSFDAFESGFCQTDDEFEARLEANLFYDYAANNWAHHALQASTLCQKVIDFLQLKKKVEAASQALMVDKYFRRPNYSQRTPRQWYGLHLAAYFGIQEVVNILLGYGQEPDLRDTYGRTPLSYAAARGHEVVVKLLLATERVEAHSKDNHGETILSYAAWGGHERVMQQLLDKDVDINSKDNLGRTILMIAATYGEEAVMQLVLDKGADIESKDEMNFTPLLRAIEDGSELAVRLLLEKGADIAPKNEYGLMPLSLAAEYGNEAIVLLLLDKGADIESRRFGQSALMYAAENGHKAVVQLLLARGARPILNIE